MQRMPLRRAPFVVRYGGGRFWFFFAVLIVSLVVMASTIGEPASRWPYVLAALAGVVLIVWLGARLHNRVGVVLDDTGIWYDRFNGRSLIRWEEIETVRIGCDGGRAVLIYRTPRHPASGDTLLGSLRHWDFFPFPVAINAELLDISVEELHARIRYEWSRHVMV